MKPLLTVLVVKVLVVQVVLGVLRVEAVVKLQGNVEPALSNETAIMDLDTADIGFGCV